MRQVFLLLFVIFIISCNSEEKPSLNQIKNSLDSDSREFATALEDGETSEAIEMIDKQYYSNNKARIASLMSAFKKDFTNLPGDTKRYTQLVFPDSFYLFRISYIDKTGIILQMDVSYKEADITSKIIGLGLITTSSFQKAGKNITPKYDF